MKVCIPGAAPALLAATLFVAACGGDVCAPYGGKTCIALEVDGDPGATVDELRVAATGFSLADGRTFDEGHDRKALPVEVAILPGDAFAGDFSLAVDGFLLENVIGHADVADTIDVPGRHLKLAVTLVGSVADVDLGQDASLPPGADLSGLDGPAHDGSTPPDLLSNPPPADSVCGTSIADAWSATTKATSSCDARVTMIVDAPFDALPGQMTMRVGINRVHIARAPTGRVGIAYGAYGSNGIDDRPLLVSTFVGDTVPPTWTTKAFGGGLGERQGTSPSIAAGPDGVMHMCYLDTSDSGNEVHYATLDNGNAFGGPDSVAASQSGDGYVGTALDGAGSIYCAYFNRADETFKARVKTGGVWGVAETVRTGSTSTMPDRGRIALKAADGSIHIAFHNPGSNTGALPMYASYSAPSWSPPKPIDNAGLSSLTANYGTSIDLAVLGARRSLAYFVPRGSMWDLRVATFDAVGDTPIYADIVTDAVNAIDDAHLAMAVDPWGQLHVVYISTEANGTGTLLYLRQYPDGLGGLKWLVDLVDTMAGVGTDTNSLDLTVDSRGRPHIVYYSGERGHLMYATRTDRI